MTSVSNCPCARGKARCLGRRRCPTIRSAAFSETCTPLRARCGALDVNTLRLNGRLIAFTYNYHFAGAVIGVRMGYDPEYASISPDRCYLAFSLRDGAARGDKILDLGTDRLNYKRSWPHEVPARHAVCVLPDRFSRAQLLRWKRRLWPTMAQTNRPPRIVAFVKEIESDAEDASDPHELARGYMTPPTPNELARAMRSESHR